MKYSIIIPTLNEEKLLPDLLKQLTELQLKELFDPEIIVSDGGSEDDTVKIALELADIVTVHTGDKLQTIAEGRNKGASLASGDILVFFNGDVRIDEPLSFFRYIDSNLKMQKYLAVTGYVSIYPEQAGTLDKIFHYCYNHYFHFLNNVGIGMGRGECHIIRNEIFKKLGGYNEIFAAGEDFDLYRRIRHEGDILFTNRIRVYESPRRFRERGYFSVTWMWIRNGISVWFKNKSISKIWEQVR